jgi:hypothetical protein
MDPVPDPLFRRKFDDVGNRTRDLWVSSQELWPLDYRAATRWFSEFIPDYPRCQLLVYTATEQKQFTFIYRYKCLPSWGQLQPQLAIGAATATGRRLLQGRCTQRIATKPLGTCKLLWIFSLFRKWQCICIFGLSWISVKYPPLEFLRHEITQLNRIWVSVNIVLGKKIPLPFYFEEFEKDELYVLSLNLFVATNLSVCRIADFPVVTSGTPPPPPLPTNFHHFSVVLRITGSVCYAGQATSANKLKQTCRLLSDPTLFWPILFHLYRTFSSYPSSHLE